MQHTIFSRFLIPIDSDMQKLLDFQFHKLSDNEGLDPIYRKVGSSEFIIQMADSEKKRRVVENENKELKEKIAKLERE